MFRTKYYNTDNRVNCPAGLKPVAYVAGNYTNGGKCTDEEAERNRDILRYYSTIVNKLGFAVICPIENDLWAYERKLITYDECLEKDFAIMSKCDLVVFCPGWEESKGAKMEYEFCIKNNIPFLEHDELEDHILIEELLNAKPR